MIEQNGNQFKINTTLHAAGTDDKFTVAFTADGKEVTVPENSPASRVGRFTTLQKIQAQWDGAALVVIMHTKHEERVGVFRTVYTLSPDGKILASSGQRHQAKLWDVVTGQEIRQLKGFSPICFAPDSKTFVWWGNDHTIRQAVSAAGVTKLIPAARRIVYR